MKHRTIKKSIFIFLFAFGLFSLHTSSLHSQSSPQLTKGDKFFDNFEFDDAINMYMLAYQMDDSAIACRKLADTFKRMGDIDQCEQWLKKAMESYGTTNDDILRYAETLKVLERYPEAIFWYEKFAAVEPDDRRAQEHIRNKYYYKDLWNDSLKYRMHKLGINSNMGAFGVVPYGDKYMFSANKVNDEFCAAEDDKDDPYLDVYECNLNEKEQFTNAIRLEGTVNSKFHDGPIFFDQTSSTMYITRNNMKGRKPVRNKNGDVILKIYTSKLVDGIWQETKSLSLNTEEYSTGHPCLSTDGKTLFFVSNKPGGYGDTDIYKSKWEDDHWGEAINLGPNINTEGAEMFPYVSKEGVIYFASNGHQGLGGLDNFMSEPWGDSWSIAYNLGSPINTNHDDFSLLFVPGEEIGFFSSSRTGNGSEDIYFFKEIEILKQELKGRLISENELISLTDKKILIKHLNKDSEYTIEIDEAGYFTMEVYLEDKIEFFMEDTLIFDGESFVAYNTPKKITDPSIDLGVFYIKEKVEEVVEENLADNSLLDDMLDMQKTLDELENQEFSKEYVVHDDTEMLVLKKEVKDLNINNIYFGFDSYVINAKASNTLEKVLIHMKENPKWKIEIDTHTDSQGSKAYNEYLSQERANSVRRYLRKNGLETDRILLRWHGEDDLDVQEKNEEDYRLNRRAEFRYMIKSDRAGKVKATDKAISE